MGRVISCWLINYSNVSGLGNIAQSANKDHFFCSLHCQQHPKNSVNVCCMTLCIPKALLRRLIWNSQLWDALGENSKRHLWTSREPVASTATSLFSPEWATISTFHKPKNAQDTCNLAVAINPLHHHLSCFCPQPSMLKKKKPSDEELLPNITVGTIAANDAAQTMGLDARLISTNCMIGLRAPRVAGVFLSLINST